MKCEKEEKKKSVQTTQPDVLKILKICFSMVDLLFKFLLPTQNLSYIFNNYIISRSFSFLVSMA